MNEKTDREDLRIRAKRLALRIMKLYGALPKSTEAQVIGKQILRSGTSVGAQFREAYRGRSTAEFVSKVSSALQELEETAYWLELLVDGDIVSAGRLEELQAEVDAILVTCVKNAKARMK
jgi:four helix bundle protein